MKDYHNLHLKVDFLLLVCLSKKESINSFAIDPAHYLSTPGYSWDVMENTMRDENHNKRGGVSMSSKGYAAANNKLLKHYDSKKVTSYIIYNFKYIINNLYRKLTCNFS